RAARAQQDRASRDPRRRIHADSDGSIPRAARGGSGEHLNLCTGSSDPQYSSAARSMAGASRAEEVTGMLLAWQQGDEEALRRLIPLVYQELRRVARARLRTEAPGHILQTTALVHEAYLRLVQVDRMNVRDRAHLLALAARLMRQVLVDLARRRRSLKRGA